jgi:hypothetical protein
MQILESNGIKDAVWVLRCFDYKNQCLFLADLAESVLHIYEAENDNQAPRLAINGIREYHAGKITEKELKRLSDAASYDARITYSAIAYTAYAAYAAAAFTAAYAVAAYAVADATANAAANAAAYATANATDAAYATAIAADAANAADAARKEKWAEIEQLFIKHFGE